MMINVQQEPVAIRPVGTVVSNFKQCSRSYDYSKESIIYIREDLTNALMGLEFYSHLHVIYYQHRREDWFKLIGWEGDEPPLTLPFDSEPVCMGVYAGRSPSRPSGMGSCVVEIIKREGNKITVKGLDAIDGTPVLDIKPYIPHYDAFPLAEVPLNWCMGNDLITTSRRLHWDTINVGLTLGLRCGSKALQLLGISRGEAVRAEVTGGHFFAQGVEGTTGCSVLHDSMVFEETHTSLGEWNFKLVGPDAEVEIRFHDRMYSDASEVLNVEDDVLYLSVEKRLKNK
jgi:tRNA-Thr(GGU) m(6)t(6)A37 methyltransferase TsaA